jgi:hypothetical protein
MGGGGRECPPTRVGAPFVPLPPPTRCRCTDAEAHKKCLDAYLEGLIAGGADLRVRLLEHKSCNHDSDDLRNICTPSFASEDGVNLLSAAGNALRRRHEFLLAARGASLPSRGACGLWAGQAPHQRHGQDTALTENLRNAVALLSLLHPVEEAPSSSLIERHHNRGGRGDGTAADTRCAPVQDVVFAGRCRLVVVVVIVVGVIVVVGPEPRAALPRHHVQG